MNGNGMKPRTLIASIATTLVALTHAPRAQSCEALRLEVSLRSGTVHFGSGFVVPSSRGPILLTAEHVLAGVPVEIRIQQGDRLIPVRVVARSWTRDLALLESADSGVALPQGCEWAPNDILQKDMPVTVLGFPAGTREMARRTGPVLELTSAAMRLVRPERGIAIGMTSLSGMSGGPVMVRASAGAAVAGMLVQKAVASARSGGTEDEAVAFAIPARELRAALEALLGGQDLDAPVVLDRTTNSVTAFGLTVEWSPPSTVTSLKGGDAYDQGGTSPSRLRVVNIDDRAVPPQWSDLALLWRRRPPGSQLYLTAAFESATGPGESTRLLDGITFARALIGRSVSELPAFDYQFVLGSRVDGSPDDYFQYLASQIQNLSALSARYPAFQESLELAKQVLRSGTNVEPGREPAVPVRDAVRLHAKIDALRPQIEEALSSDDTYQTAVDLLVAHARMETRFGWLRRRR